MLRRGGMSPRVVEDEGRLIFLLASSLVLEGSMPWTATQRPKRTPPPAASPPRPRRPRTKGAARPRERSHERRDRQLQRPLSLHREFGALGDGGSHPQQGRREKIPRLQRRQPPQRQGASGHAAPSPTVRLPR